MPKTKKTHANHTILSMSSLFTRGSLFIFLFLILIPFFSQASINPQISYQGKLTDASGNIVSDGSYNMVFKIYNTASGGVPLWTGNYTAANGNPISLSSGIFSVLLGSGTGNSLNLDFSATAYYLGVTIGTDPEMTPRKRIGSVPQAYNANNLIGDGFIKITGLPTGTQVSEGTVYINPSSAASTYTLLGAAVNGSQKMKLDASGNLTVEGNVGIGQASPAAYLHLKAGTAAANTAPIKLTSGTNLTTPEAGALEFNGTDLFFTPSTTRETIAFMSDLTGASHNAVTLAGTYDYLALAGQEITLNQIDLATDITGILPVANGGTGANTLNDLIALTTHTTGNYVASITNGSGISGGNGGSEGAALTLALGALTADWSQTGAFDIALANASSELKIMGSGGTYYGIFDVGNITGSDKTYTFPDASGTVAMTSDLHSAVTLAGENYLSLSGQQITANAINLAGTNVTGILPLANGGTNANLTAVQGGIVYSGASALAISAAGTTGQALISGGTGSPAWTTGTLTLGGNLNTANAFITSGNYSLTLTTTGTTNVTLPTSGTLATTSQIVSDHGALTGLSDDDHSIYALLAGRAGGQILIGGTGTTDDLILRTTSGVGASGADMIFQVGSNGGTEAMRILNSGYVGIGTTAPAYKLDVNGSGQFTGTPAGSGVSQGTLYVNPAQMSSDPVVQWSAQSSWNAPDAGATIHPAFADLDNDGDFDLLIGEFVGISYAYKNTGSNTSPVWTAEASWNVPDIGVRAAPAFADLDNDGDYDLLIGDYNSGISYAYENTGSVSSPTWAAKSAWDAPDVGIGAASPIFADLDNDGDKDLLIGEYYGISYAYENTGSISSPTWTAKSAWNTPDVGTLPSPAFADLDNDGDEDLLIGEDIGISYAYENTGSNTNPVWTAKSAWNAPDIGTRATPAFADLDNDGDEDLLIGEDVGISYAFKNTGTGGATGNTLLGLAVNGSEKLRVTGTGAINAQGYITSQSYGSFTYNGDLAALTVRQNGAGNILDLKDGATTIFTVLDGGSVGIGAAIPGAKLDVRGGINAGTNGTEFAISTAGLITTASVNSASIVDNSVTGADIALGSDAQGDIMYYNGTDWARLTAGTSGYFLKTQGAAADPIWAAASAGVTDHGALTGLSDDDHTQYAILAGRSGGQTLIGGTVASENLTLQSTSNATKGKILFGTSAYDEANNRLGIGTTSPAYKLDVSGSGQFTGTPAGSGVSQGSLYINPPTLSTAPVVQWTAQSSWNAPDAGARTKPAFADLDGDGDYDLLVGAQDGISYAYKNTGSNTSPVWTAEASWNAPDLGGHVAPAFADLDNDGDYDLIIGEENDQICLAYENTGTASSPAWTAKPAWNTPSMASNGLATRPAFADLDNDGDYDLMIGDNSGVSYGFENTGTASSPAWAAKPAWNTSALPGNNSAPFLADLDNDGDYDIMSGLSDGIVYGYENTGSTSNPVWTAKSSWNTSDIGYLANPALADLDNDGDYDLMIGEDSGISYAYKNTGSGGATGNTLLGIAVNGSEKFRVNGLGGITANGLFDLNSYLDLDYAGTSAAASITQSGIGDILNIFDGSTEVLTVLDGGNVGIGTTSPGSALDVKGTLRLSGSTSGYVGFAPAAAAGSTTYTLPNADGTSGQVLSTNGSGALSWTTAGGSLGWSNLTNPSANLALTMGAYTSTFTYNAATGANNLFNLTDTVSNTGTGYLLNVTTAIGSTLKPFHVSAAGTEALTVLANGNVGIGTASPAYKLDVSGSGQFTGIPTGAGISNGPLYINPSSYSAAPIVQWTAKSAWNSQDVGDSSRPALADLDNDGDQDLIIGESSGISYAFENTGSASSPNWSAKPSWNAPDVGSYASPAFADLDNDGDKDLLIGTNNGISYGYENTGSVSSPVWTAKSSWNTPYYGYNNLVSPALSDLNNDGDYDVILGGGDGSGSCYFYAYENTGSVSSPVWSRKTVWDIPALSSCFDGKPGLSDLDNDGDYDMLGGGWISVAAAYENTGSVSSPIWTRKSAWDSIAWYNAPAFADLDNDGDKDMILGAANGGGSGIGTAYENTGSLASTANTLLGIAVNGSEKFRVNGLGGITANGLFDLNSYLDLDYAGTSAAVSITQSGTGDILNIFDGSTEVLTVLDGGSVGIGATIPGAKLDVRGGINAGTNGTEFAISTAGLITTASVNSASIVDNSVTGADIALGSDAQGDIMYYNGTDWARLTAGTSGYFLKTQGAAADPIWAAASAGVTDHGALTGLSDDDHTQYAILAGRTGGQTLIGGTGTTDDLILRTTSGVGASGADMIFQVGSNGGTEAMRILNSGYVGIGTTTPSTGLTVATIPTGSGVSQGSLYVNPPQMSSAAVVSWSAKSVWNTPDVGVSSKPAFVDLDNDGDYDLLIGSNDGFSYAYENTGTVTSPIWTAKTAWNAPDVGVYSAPIFADLDNDGDYDLLIGAQSNGCFAYENTGTVSSPVWTAKTAWDIGAGFGYTDSVPAFADIDNDGDYDLLIGEYATGVSFAYENTGTTSSPVWTAKTVWNAPDVGQYASPAFADLDSDGDFDLLIGEQNGISYGYENTGTVSSPIWTAKTAWNTLDVGLFAHPAFADIDNDGDYDLLIGEDGGISYAYENTGSGGATGNTLFGIAVNGSEKFRVNGLGGITANGLFDLNSYLDLDYAGTSAAVSITQSGTGDILNIFDGSTEVLTVLDGGNVGIGTASPTALLHLDGSAGKVSLEINSNETTAANNILMLRSDVASADDPIFRVQADGAVFADGAYTGTGADYAEYFATKDTDLKSGEAVCVDTQKDNAVKRCARSGDNDIMGIVSSHPSIVGNSADGREKDPNYKVIGMLGQIAANISSENGNIQIGDSLTSANTPGYLRKADAGESTVGVALQKFDGKQGSIQMLISRRNKSLTVEKVEEAVTQRIADMNVQDQVDKMIADATTELAKNTETQLIDIGGRVITLETLADGYETRIKSQEDLTAQLQTQIDELKKLANAELNLAQIEQSKNDIDYLKLVLGLDRAENGSIHLLGNLEADGIVAGAFTVKIVDEEKKTIGTAVIKAITKDEDGDGIDDETGSDGKSVVVKTKAVSKDSRIFITISQADKAVPIKTGDIKEGESFEVKINDPAISDISFDWWAVEAK